MDKELFDKLVKSMEQMESMLKDVGKLSYTIDGVVRATSLSRSSIYKSIADGSLRSIKVGRRRMVTRKALEEYISKLEGVTEHQTAKNAKNARGLK
jgi:excisionase family DNA binding protein